MQQQQLAGDAMVSVELMTLGVAHLMALGRDTEMIQRMQMAMTPGRSVVLPSSHPADWHHCQVNSLCGSQPTVVVDHLHEIPAEKNMETVVVLDSRNALLYSLTVDSITDSVHTAAVGKQRQLVASGCLPSDTFGYGCGPSLMDPMDRCQQGSAETELGQH
jgi:hypothetical protein